MLSSRPLDKENASYLLSSSKALLPDGGKSTKIGGMIKKKVFGDVKNTIQSMESGVQTLKTMKNKEMQIPAECTLSKSIRVKEEETWPEPEILPASLSFEDDYEDCFPPDYPRSGLSVECSLFLRPPSKTNSICPDSPIQLKPQQIRDIAPDVEMELLPGVFDFPPNWDDIF